MDSYYLVTNPVAGGNNSFDKANLTEEVLVKFDSSVATYNYSDGLALARPMEVAVLQLVS